MGLNTIQTRVIAKVCFPCGRSPSNRTSVQVSQNLPYWWSSAGGWPLTEDRLANDAMQATGLSRAAIFRIRYMQACAKESDLSSINDHSFRRFNDFLEVAEHGVRVSLCGVTCGMAVGFAKSARKFQKQ